MCSDNQDAVWINCDISDVFDELEMTLEEIGLFIKAAFEYLESGNEPTIRGWNILRDYVSLTDPLENN